jgi:outer membrane receptor protein involved in Fe transport
LPQINPIIVSKKYLLLCISFLTALTTFAQTGKITGKVLNEKNEALLGVSIKITGAPGGTTTDVNGQYTLTLAAGKKYELTFSVVGYTAKTINEIDVVAGQVTDLNLVLETSKKSLDAITVTATRSARRETTASLIQFQKNTNTVAAVVSAESIRRSPDKNTGEVLKRVPGTSVQEGKYLVVRGLSDRYNIAMLNGIQLSSTEPDRKTFSFDIFPAAMIDNIIINKAFVPELPGEWAGGLVQVNTKDIPAANFLNVQVGTGFNSATIGKDFYKYDGGRTDWLGLDDGTRSLPGSFPAKNQFGALSNADKIAQYKSLNTSWGISQIAAPINTSFQLSGGFNTKIFKKEVGATLALTYNRSHRNLEFQNAFVNFQNNIGTTLLDYNNNKYSSDVLWGALANVSIKLNNNHKISVKNLLNINNTDYVTLRGGNNFEDGETVKARELGFRTNTFYNTQVLGEHNLRALKSKFTWYGSFNILDQYIPMQRRLLYSRNINDASAPFLPDMSSTPSSQESGSLFYSYLSDYIYNAGGDVTTSFDLFGNKQSIKAGYLFQVKDRLFNARPFSIYIENTTSPLVTNPIAEDQLFNPGNFDAGDPAKFKVDEIVGTQYRYLANTILNAGYLQFDNQFTRDLRVVWGVRYEHFDQLVGSVNKNDPRHTYSKVGDFLPAINITYKTNATSNLRLSASQTVVRPEFRELTNFTFYDFEVGGAVVGNSQLKRTKITNFDVRYEIYPRAGELFTLGVFYKQFKNPIEQFLNQTGPTSFSFNYGNVDKATGYGVEFEMRKKLDFANALKNFTLQTNLSYIHNRVKDEDVSVDRPMQGQSPYVINVALQYDLEKIGLNTTLLFNQIGRRILYVGNLTLLEIWENPRPLFDLQVAKKLFNNKGEIRLNVSDILNKRAYFYHDVDDNKKFKTGTDKVAIERNYGTNVSLTFGYTIK